MKRREFITLLGGTAAAWPLAASAQQPAMPVIGLLDARSPGAIENPLRAFRQGLKDTGYVEGENVALEYRWAENQMDRLPALAAEFVRRRATVIAAIAPATVFAATAATTTIPIVFIVNEDPGRRPREHHKRTTGQRTWPRRAAPARMRRSHPRIWRMRRIIEDRERCLQAGWIFGRDRPPKKPRRSGAAKWEERRPKKDHYSLAESSKCVQIDVAFIPHASDPQASAM
jgi:ABC transporter substrate binding protein